MFAGANRYNLKILSVVVSQSRNTHGVVREHELCYGLPNFSPLWRCHFANSLASVIVSSHISKDPGQDLTLLLLATITLTMKKVWIGASKIKSSLQSRLKIKIKCQKPMQGRWLLWVLKVLSQIQAIEIFHWSQRNGKPKCIIKHETSQNKRY